MVMDNVKRIDSFIGTLSTDRFERYLNLAEGNEGRALELYACNARLSQSLYIPLQILEITLRNSIHECLKVNGGEFWFDKSSFVILESQIRQLNSAKE